jgi:hypothetical protein
MKRYILAIAMTSLVLSTASYAQSDRPKNAKPAQTSKLTTVTRSGSLSSTRVLQSYDMLDRSEGSVPSVIERMPYQPGSGH